MRILSLVALLLMAPLASAQIAPLAPEAPAFSDDAIVLIAVPTESLPEGFVDTLPALPEGAEMVSLPETSLSYSIPQETLAAMNPKDEDMGLLFSILITGGGHLYAGETSKGLTLLGVGLGSLVAGSVLSVSTDSVVPYLLGFGVYIGTWIYGISDAKAAVRRYNAANGFTFVPAPVEAGGDVGIGLAMRARF